MTSDTNEIKFPKGFYWGASTASHQVEGNTHNDWCEWEKSKKRLKYLEITGLAAKHGLDNYISGNACDHYHLYEQDFKMAKGLGHNATRFSIEWARIEPEEGKFDEKEIEHYRKVIKYIKSLGMEPFVTIWHWTMPTWFTQKGAFENEENIKYFAKYVKRVIEEYKDDVKYWITLNEPDVYSSSSYLTGIWTPQKHNLFTWIKVIHNLIKAHNTVYPIIKKIDKDSQVGIAKNNVNLTPSGEYFINWIAAKFLNWMWNNYIFDKIGENQDFLGLNYYFKYKFNLFRINIKRIMYSVGKKLAPSGIYRVLMNLKQYNKPVYITENGLPDEQDKYRTWYIYNILENVHAAIEKGVDVRGYLHWSLMDNFEWHKGFRARFGLVEVDFKTQERKIRPSAYFYKAVCENNGITERILQKFNVSKPK